MLYYIYVVNPGVAGGGRGRVNPVIAAGLEKARNKAERVHEVSIFHASDWIWPQGASTYDVRKIVGFFYPFPLVTVTNQQILFLLSAFWGPPAPPPADVIYGSPLSLFSQQLPEKIGISECRDGQTGGP